MEVTALTAHGRFWEELELGSRFRTRGRTLTESDLVNFVAYLGFSESLFQDETYVQQKTDFPRRLIPAALTFAASEGLVIQSGLLDETGIALLEAAFRVEKPVFVGDTVRVELEVTEVRPTSAGGRAVVKTANRVLNQEDEVVMEYWPVRLIRGRGSEAGEP